MRSERAQQVLGALGVFLRAETTGAAILLAATAVAIAWANSPAAPLYEALWRTPLEVRVGEETFLSLDLRHWVNDALMALFFFVVGLEIKRELVEGELSSRAKAMLPALAALGGMVVPAAIYLALNAAGPHAGGWGIPMATDIAFAVGVLAVLGRRVPAGLKVLLLSIAIADDIGAIVVIAVFYTSAIDPVAVAFALAALVAVVALWRIKAFWSDPPLVVLMLVVWLATLASGVHATIAGVALGLLAPARGGELPPAQRLERTLHPWTSYVIVPLFALANAGIALDLDALTAAVTSPVALGVATGLVLGKPIGIAGAAWLAVRSGIASLPEGVRWPHVVGLATVAGVGFTVSLFIADLALEGETLSDAKVGVFAGSVLAAAAGLVLLSRSLRRAG